MFHSSDTGAQGILEDLWNQSGENLNRALQSTVYNAAWLSRINKDGDAVKGRLFPQSFCFILDTQESDGGWDSRISHVDSILSTGASLLAIHDALTKDGYTGSVPTRELQTRADKAMKALQNKFAEWDIPATHHADFELLVSALLFQLDEAGYCVSFPARGRLRALQERRLLQLDIRILYSSERTSVHALIDGMIGRVDFDRLLRSQQERAIVGISPSGAAICLLYAPVLDKAVENYLERNFVPGSSHRSLLCTESVVYFDLTVVLSVLMLAGVLNTVEQDGKFREPFDKIVEAFRSGQRTLGFDEGSSPDVDSTARAIIIMACAGREVDATGLINHFERDTYFVNFADQDSTNVGANCHALLALLHVGGSASYTAQITKCSMFVYQRWYESNVQIRDRWNHSPFYTMMLMAMSFGKMVTMWDGGELPGLDTNFMETCVPLLLFQLLSRVLQAQREDGFWSSAGAREQTAYALMTIAATARLTFSQFLKDEIGTAIMRGREALSSPLPPGDIEIEYLWINKTTFRSSLICEAHVVAALKLTENIEIPSNADQIHGQVDMLKVEKFIPFYAKLLTIGSLPMWRIRISLMEGCLFGPLIKYARLEVFPARSLGDKEETYWDNIRFTWCCVNSIDLTFAPISFIIDWMKISYLNYQLDEYMEAIVALRFRHDLPVVENVVEEVMAPEVVFAKFDHTHPRIQSSSISQPSRHGAVGSVERFLANGHRDSAGLSRNTLESTPVDADKTDLEEVRRVLTLLRDWTFTHPRVVNASRWHLEQTRYEMKEWLLGHFVQMRDCERLAAQAQTEFLESPISTQYQWSSRVAADHTSCPYAYELLLALVSDAEDVFSTPEEKYYSAAANRHLSTLCRLENDYGSIDRDFRERNLNSIHFPEWHTAGAPTYKDRKIQLLRVAQYEREKYNDALARLDRLAENSPTKKRNLQLIRVMTSTTDSWGQMYVLRDLARSIETITEANNEQLIGAWKTRAVNLD